MNLVNLPGIVSRNTRDIKKLRAFVCNLIPDTTGQDGKVLSVNNGILEWIVGGGGGGGTGVTDGDKGDIVVSGSGLVWMIDAGVVTLSKMANLAANSIIGNNTASPATPLALSGTQVTAMLDTFTSSNKGLVSASGGGTTNFLRADGTWAAPPGNISGTGSAGQVSYWTGTSTQAGSNNLFWDNANGSLGVGNNTPTARLHVVGTGTTSTTALLVQDSTPSELFKVLDNGSWNFNGDGIVKGSGSTSATVSLSIQTSNGQNVARFRNDGFWLLGNNSNRPLFGPVSGISSPSVSATAVQLQIDNSANRTGGFDYLISSATRDYTSGAVDVHRRTANFTPTSGTGVFNMMALINTINQTGGANGITRGLFIDPTLTSAANWRSIQWTNNTGWGLHGSGTADNYLNGNTSIGTTTVSARLQVRGSGATSATTALLVENSTPTNIIEVPDSGGIIVSGTTGTWTIEAKGTSNSGGFRRVGNSIEVVCNNAIVGFVGGSGTLLNLNSFGGGSTTNSSGSAVNIANAFNFNASSANTRGLTINPTINQTGSASFTLIDLSPTINTTGTGINYLLSSINFKIKYDGGLIFNNSANFTFDTTTGTKIGTATTEKLSFWNATPVSQQSGNIVDALSTIGLVATPTLYTSATATLTTAGWSLVGGYYEQDIANTNITATSLVNIIPDNNDVQTVIDAKFLPANDSSAGSVKVYAKNLPTANINVTLIILK